MFVHRVLFVTQGTLTVWVRSDTGLRQAATFADDDAGFARFDRYIADRPEIKTAMLLDVIEEEFAYDSVPRLGLRDRAALLQRRAEKKFRRTPYRITMLQGKSVANPSTYDAVYSAISNHELIEPWTTVLGRHKVPLAGIYSVPLMAAREFGVLFDTAGPALFVAQHQGARIRQVFVRDGQIRSARLSQSARDGVDDFANAVVHEAVRSRRYLERTRMLGGQEALNVCIITDDAMQARIREMCDAHSLDRFSFVNMAKAAKKGRWTDIVPSTQCEILYISRLLRHRPGHSYAQSNERRYWSLRRIRSALIVTATTTAAVASCGAALLFADAWLLDEKTTTVNQQVQQLSATYRRENEVFSPIKADSEEMQLAVDAGNYILKNRVPVPWVLNQLGAVMGGYPDVRLRDLQWRVESTVEQPSKPLRRGDRPMPVVLSNVGAVHVELHAEIHPFDGNLRAAFARIDQLTRDIETRTHFSTASAVEYPFDSNTGAAVSGEIDTVRRHDAAGFTLRIRFHPGAITGEPAAAQELNDDAI